VRVHDFGRSSSGSAAGGASTDLGHGMQSCLWSEVVVYLSVSCVEGRNKSTLQYHHVLFSVTATSSNTQLCPNPHNAHLERACISGKRKCDFAVTHSTWCLFLILNDVRTAAEGRQRTS
jgi:hypothetical protein